LLGIAMSKEMSVSFNKKTVVMTRLLILHIIGKVSYIRWQQLC
jgi:hypothetical protein